jgi:hypothetical protein
VRIVKAEDFQILINTNLPKKQKHHFYGDKIIKIIGSSPLEGRYEVEWQDGFLSFIKREYIEKFHREMLVKFDISNSFKRYILDYRKSFEASNMIVIN